MTQHHVIYVPGIGDDLYRVQSSVIKLWRLQGVYPHFHAMPWLGSEVYEVKFQHLLELVNKLVDEGCRVSLVGASAGASAVLNAYAERPDRIAGVSYICGKINHPETVSERTYAANPAFKTSVEVLQGNLIKLSVASKSRVRSYYSLVDRSVPYEDTRIPGVEERALPAVRHGFAILYAITLGSPHLLSYLKHQV